MGEAGGGAGKRICGGHGCAPKKKVCRRIRQSNYRFWNGMMSITWQVMDADSLTRYLFAMTPDAYPPSSVGEHLRLWRQRRLAPGHS
jgi:hypothetical protein